MLDYSSFWLLFITIIISLISLSILFIKILSKKKGYISSTYYDGFLLYYIPNNNVQSTKINNNEIKRCLNGGTPNIRNGIFSECNCPDNFIGPMCEYENLMRPSDGFTVNN